MFRHEIFSSLTRNTTVLIYNNKEETQDFTGHLEALTGFDEFSCFVANFSIEVHESRVINVNLGRSRHSQTSSTMGVEDAWNTGDMSPALFLSTTTLTL